MSKRKSVHGDERELHQLLHRDFQRVRCDGYMALAKVRGRDRSTLRAELARAVELNL